MKLEEALHNKRHKIVDRWVVYTLETYQASQFFTREKDSFANPVGGTVRDSLKKIFSLLIQNQETAAYKEPLSRLMHLRSVQEFTPSQAVAPLNAVKHITRDVLAADKETKPLTGELYDFEFSVDLAVLAAFDLYVECREKIYKIRVDEIRSGKQLLTDGACPSKALKNITDIKR
jgi:hypothetical protein